jgi:RNA polymerase sigma-70 factor (ECF subfamily)
VALHHLPARQRAVLILRDVLEFSAREVADALGTTVPAINCALQRARRTISGTLPQPSQQATLRSLGSVQVRAVIERFVDACEAGDVGAILALLAEDVTFAMPPHPGWWRGRDAVAESWLMPSEPEPSLRYVPARANGQLAFGAYVLDEEHAHHLPIALDVLTLRGTAITNVTAFRIPELFPSFGLPSEISATSPSRVLERRRSSRR